ncbi:MAG: nucleotide exchange factor GrpE [Planctomycetaceae bacterium]
MSDQKNQDTNEGTIPFSADPAPQSPAQSEPTGESPADPLAQAIADRDQFRDQLLRSHAELDNFRKRSTRERDEERRYAQLSFVRELLPVLDNLHRAIDAASKGGTIDDLRQGVEMVANQAREMLVRFQVEPIPALGEAFDPNIHEALTQIPSADHPPMTVLQEVEPGYKLHDRVIRPAKVIVSS